MPPRADGEVLEVIDSLEGANTGWAAPNTRTQCCFGIGAGEGGSEGIRCGTGVNVERIMYARTGPGTIWGCVSSGLLLRAGQGRRGRGRTGSGGCREVPSSRNGSTHVVCAGCRRHGAAVSGHKPGNGGSPVVFVRRVGFREARGKESLEGLPEGSFREQGGGLLNQRRKDRKKHRNTRS